MNEILAPSPKPSDLAATDQDLRTLEAESNAQRRALMQTVDQIEDRLSSTMDSVVETVDATQDVLNRVDRSVREYRWAFVAGAVVVGVMVGKSGSRRQDPVPVLPSPKRSLAAGLLSLAVGTAAKTVAASVARGIVEGQAASTNGDPEPS